MTDRIAEIRALLAAASPGFPWQVDSFGHCANVMDSRDERKVASTYDPGETALIAAAPDLLAWCVAEIERLRGVQSGLRDWAQGRVETLTRCIATEGVPPSTQAEMMYERTIMRDIVAMLDEATP